MTSDVKLQWKFFFYCLHLSNKLFKNDVVSFFLESFTCGLYIFPNIVPLLKCKIINVNYKSFFYKCVIVGVVISLNVEKLSSPNRLDSNLVIDSMW